MLIRSARRKLLNILPPNIGQFIRVNSYRLEGRINRLRFLGLKEPDNGWPSLLGISMPKNGTHLLEQILRGFSHVAPFTPHVPYVISEKHLDGEYISSDQVIKRIDKLRPLDVTKAHMVFSSEVAKRIKSSDFLNYFIYRDLRDVVVSTSYYLGEMEKYHPLHAHYKPLSVNERMKVTICGFSDPNYSFLNIGKRAFHYLGWINEPAVLSIRFEDLIHDRRETIGHIVDHFLKRVDTLPSSRDEIVRVLENNIDPKRSPTFRSGKTGEWRQHFTEEHKKLFKDLAGDVLIKMGYEKNNDW